MLIKAKGRCQNCNTEFGPHDVMQSVNVKCDNCGLSFKFCKSCKEKGCNCGGKLEDVWDKNPDIMY